MLHYITRWIVRACNVVVDAVGTLLLGTVETLNDLHDGLCDHADRCHRAPATFIWRLWSRMVAGAAAPVQGLGILLGAGLLPVVFVLDVLNDYCDEWLDEPAAAKVPIQEPETRKRGKMGCLAGVG